METDHEEADTKIAYLIQHAVRSSNGQEIICVVRSSSGDIDIPIISLGMDLENNVQIFIDNGSRENRKLLELNLCDLTDQQKNHWLECMLLEVMIMCRAFFAKGNSYAGDLSVAIEHSWIYLVVLARKYS